MTRRIALITTTLVLALAAPAGAQSGPFGPLPPAEPTPTATPELSSIDNGETSISTIFLIGGALLAGFGAMGWFIMRDARSKAPEVAMAGPVVSDGTHRPHTAAQKKKMRQKNRAQKQARKAHRKR